jgi:hypothetical protein
MVGVIVAHDHPHHWLIGNGANLFQQHICQRRRAERVEHHHAGTGDNDAGIGNEALIFRSDSGYALNEPDMFGNPLELHVNRCGGIFLHCPALRDSCGLKQKQEKHRNDFQSRHAYPLRKFSSV